MSPIGFVVCLILLQNSPLVPTQDIPPCMDLLGVVHSEDIRNNVSLPSYLSSPTCDSDGSYSRLQCGDDVCTCVDRHGQRIIGNDVGGSDRNGMDCNCARDQAENYVYGVNCNWKGSYNPVQCSGTLHCFCVNSQGERTGSTVYFWESSSLECFSRK